jgi:Tol biopolymer transport system component
MISLQWAPLGGGSRRRAVITMNTDGTNIRTAVTNDQWSRGGHHINWCPDGNHVSMNLNIDADLALELITVNFDGSDLRQVFKPGSGHPSFHPGGRYIITDAYPYEPLAFGDGTVPIRLIDTQTGSCTNIVRVYVSSTKNEFRIDAHPAWDRSGRYVVFNGFEGNTRKVYIADLSGVLK